MIATAELHRMAAEQGLRFDQVEKDYRISQKSKFDSTPLVFRVFRVFRGKKQLGFRLTINPADLSTLPLLTLNSEPETLNFIVSWITGRVSLARNDDSTFPELSNSGNLPAEQRGLII